MERIRFYYLIRIQYLGFRFSGWQKQPNQLTIEGMLSKTLKYVLPEKRFKLLASGRTDAKVSALNGVFELFLENHQIADLEEFIAVFNKNLPPDIRVTQIEPTNADFNIIQNSKSKEYTYLFSFGEKNHPFCAPFLANIVENLDIDEMMSVAELFKGTHDFSAYTARLQPNTKVIRNVNSCNISNNELISASFFPKNSYALTIKGDGFMRYQIRMIMGALFQVGKGELSKQQIIDSLKPNNTIQLTTVAPGSGLILNQVEFKTTT
ncbi:tRNA pseudouridine(38-40) synthase TruA [Maribacter sp. CXY002]|uniref:tRNA pseudouridine(38-40) synthase TruA n=1 Tax=Maribacter luteocoastalis TaxID=3407671 RepID=UPI003B675E96